jgi:hypothetical protein
MKRDNSTHPKHYHGKVEPIDLIIAQGFGPGFCAGSVLKYVCRADKSSEQVADLRKAQWYLDKLVFLVGTNDPVARKVAAKLRKSKARRDAGASA